MWLSAIASVIDDGQRAPRLSVVGATNVATTPANVIVELALLASPVA
jgi:hypothetical protein